MPLSGAGRSIRSRARISNISSSFLAPWVMVRKTHIPLPGPTGVLRTICALRSPKGIAARSFAERIAAPFHVSSLDERVATFPFLFRLALPYIPDVDPRQLARFVALLFAILFAVAAVNAEVAHSRLNAFTDGRDVYVDFAIASPVVDGFDSGFLERHPAAVKWEIDLIPAGPLSQKKWWDRVVRRSTLEVIVNPSTVQGTCKMRGELTGRWLEPPQVLACAAAYRVVSSFDERVFTVAGLERGSFDVTIRATVVREQIVNVKTPVLARARLVATTS